MTSMLPTRAPAPTPTPDVPPAPAPDGVPAPAHRPDAPVGRARAVASAVAVAATVPYLGLKLLWLTGHPVGAGDGDAMDDLWLVNLLTFGMDTVAVLLALSFVRPWGRRAPAGLVAFPMWVATGLLGTLLVALPLFLLATLLLGPDQAPPGTDDGPSGWVFPVVYGGFAVQGLALITGFLLYARERWAGLLRHDRIGDLPRSPTLTTQRAFACVAAPLAAGVAAARVYWACGGTTGLPLEWQEYRGRGVAVMDGVTALMAVAAGAALLLLVFRGRPGWRLRGPLAVLWTAAGSLFGWGSWQLVAFGTFTAAPDPRRAVPGLLTLVKSAQVVTGLLVLAVGAIALAERSAAGAAPTIARAVPDTARAVPDTARATSVPRRIRTADVESAQ
ncbi:hypothetical protein [Streptomyces sp. TLI_053]|uniref:hypothetical protein n=1 Tax=Streptomyces sp. TLI_053 TaxID=1855352 RepID=UPI000B8862E7|nr:hypothetical protein [Streptomyces sp. TLI_053]